MGCEKCDEVTTYYPFEWHGALIRLKACHEHTEEIVSALESAAASLQRADFVELCEAERDCILSGNALTPLEQIQCVRTIDNIITRMGVLEPEPRAAHVKGPLDFSGSPKPVRKPSVDRKAHD